jgi:two-component system CheB/CheR fusion protein
VQAVSNLLGNAEKFTERGGRVVVGLRRSGPRTAVVSVRDNGAGISLAMQPHMFEPFSQAPQTVDRSRGGLGLGLAMVKGLVELHGGSVAITSPGRDRGTEAAITLPLIAEPAPRTKAPSSPPRPPPNSRRVLVIEDNADLAVSLHDALSLAGHDVKVATDGAAGLERARSFRPEIVLCDLGLPGMDGFAVARAFRTQDELRGTYLVALSGYAQHEHVRRALEAGFDRHMAKPPSLESLTQIFAAASASDH